MISTTPPQRTKGTFSCRTNRAATVVKTKPSAVSGQMKLTSPCLLGHEDEQRPEENRLRKKRPGECWRLVAPLLMTRTISATLTFPHLLKLFQPLAQIHHAHRLEEEAAINNKISSLVMLQILVPDELDVQARDQRLHLRTGQSVKFGSKFIQRRVRVKLRIARGQAGQQAYV